MLASAAAGGAAFSTGLSGNRIRNKIAKTNRAVRARTRQDSIGTGEPINQLAEMVSVGDNGPGRRSGVVEGGCRPLGTLDHARNFHDLMA